MNDIAELELETSLPLFFDPYAENRSTGSFILIDPLSNATLGAGMLLASLDTETAAPTAIIKRPSLILLPGEAEALRALQAGLQTEGEAAVIVDDDLIPEASLPRGVRALQLAGVIALSAKTTLLPHVLQALRTVAGEGLIEGREALQAWHESGREGRSERWKSS